MIARLAAVATALLLVVSCSSDGERTRPTLPSRTTVAVTEPGATAPPVTEPPATQPPVVETTAPAVTEPGATAPAPTEAPATNPPATNPPATPAPTTAPPATETPTTVPPATVPVTEPAGPETTVVAGTDDGDDGTTWWPWLVLAVLVIGGGIALAVRRRGPAWPDRATALLDEVDALSGRLSVHTPEGLRAVAAAEAQALAQVRARLAELVAAAPDDARRAQLDPLTAPVAELHTAVGAVSLSPSLPSPEQHQAVIRAAAIVHTTSATARITIAPPPPPPNA